VTATGARLASALVLALAAGAGGGCTVGSGSGSAVGPLYVLGCNTKGSPTNLGSPLTPVCFNLAPTFFAGTPIEDLPMATMPANRLTIRMQTTGSGIQGASTTQVFGSNTFTVDVLNAFQVARCLRGRCLPDGTPDWDTRNVANLTGGFTDTPWCDWGPNPCAGGGVDGGVAADGGPADGAAPDGGSPADGGELVEGIPSDPTCSAQAQTRAVPGRRPLIHLGPLEYVIAQLYPVGTCPSAFLVGIAVEGSIDFIQFGQATSLATINPDFKVNFGERLEANFHAVLQDNRVVNKINTLQMVPAPEIGGQLDGFFDFILDRGRAAQPFP